MTIGDIMVLWSYKSPIYVTTSAMGPARYEDCCFAILKPQYDLPDEVKKILNHEVGELHVTKDGKFIVTID